VNSLVKFPLPRQRNRAVLRHPYRSLVLYLGDAQTVLRRMPSNSIDVCVTSPPYWGLRDYAVPATVWGGEPSCSHIWGDWERGRRKDLLPVDQTNVERIGPHDRQGRAPCTGGRYCRACDAWLGCLGLEPTPEQYVANLVGIFREVRRVLKTTGTLWLNLGDSYTSGGRRTRHSGNEKMHGPNGAVERLLVPAGLKPKDLVGIPWRVAFGLQADGWYLRSDIVWAKPNSLPESVRDRPSRNHEYLFLLAKSERYFYDSVTMREPCRSGSSDIHKMLESLPRIGGKHKGLCDPRSKVSAATNIGRRRAVGSPDGRNRRSVWTIATAPYRGTHFATFPAALVEPCIRSGTSERGCCPRCGAPWQRETSVSYENPGRRMTNGPRSLARRHEAPGFSVRLVKRVSTLGWHPTCGCPANQPIACTVLDPFAGSGTTLMVATNLGRRAIGIELNLDYERLIRRRCANDGAKSGRHDGWISPSAA